MQSDYMVLRYAIARGVPRRKLQGKGHIVVSLDENEIANLVRVHQGDSLNASE